LNHISGWKKTDEGVEIFSILELLAAAEVHPAPTAPGCGGRASRRDGTVAVAG
jgi:hypothetical protein